MGNINIYTGCGCGCGGSVPPVPSPFAGNSGGASTAALGSQVSTGLTDTASKCDVVSSVVPYIIDQAQEFFEGLSQSLGLGGSVFDYILGIPAGAIDQTAITNNSIEFLADLVEGGVDPIVNALKDTDFELRAQEVWWKRFSEDTWDSITRAQLLEWAYALPALWGNIITGNGSSPKLFMGLFAAIADVQKISGRIFLARGNGNTALCTYLASTIGEEYTAPVAQLTAIPFIGSVTENNYRYSVYKITNDVLLNDDQDLGALPGNIAAVYTSATVIEAQNNGGRNINIRLSDSPETINTRAYIDSAGNADVGLTFTQHYYTTFYPNANTVIPSLVPAAATVDVLDTETGAGPSGANGILAQHDGFREGNARYTIYVAMVETI